MQGEKLNIQLLLIGKKGNGQSSLGNFILGEKRFEVHYFPYLTTQNIIKSERNGLTIIDNPGLLDNENSVNNKNPEDHYKDLIKYIKSLYDLNGIIIVLDSQDMKNDDDIKNMIKMICNSFEYKNFKFISFAFTRYYGNKETKEKLKKIKEDFVDEIKKLVKNFYGQNELSGVLPYFFFNSDLKDPDYNSLINRQEIIQWAYGLPLFNIKELDEKHSKYKKIFEDYNNQMNRNIRGNYICYEYIIYKSKKAIDLNDKTVCLNLDIIRKDVNLIPDYNTNFDEFLGETRISKDVLKAPFSRFSIEKKSITVRDLETNKEIDIEIFINQTIKELKVKIEKLINRKILTRLMLQQKGRRTPHKLNDEDLTISEARIHNGDIITITKTEILG